MEHLFYQPHLDQGAHELSEEESRHCIKVLRKKGGEPLLLTDGKGFFYEARIEKPDARNCTFQVTRKYAQASKDYSIHLAISPTKHADRLEWMIEKCVEIGVDQISFINCDHTERQRLKTERLRKVALSAMKQSQRATLPSLNELIGFSEFIQTISMDHQRFIAYVDQSNPEHLMRRATPKANYVALVGPEGDFSIKELDLCKEKGFQKVSLGPYRLRTETAGLTACMILNLINS